MKDGYHIGLEPRFKQATTVLATIESAQILFNPPMWKVDAQELLTRSIEKNYPNLRLIDTTTHQVTQKKELAVTA